MNKYTREIRSIDGTASIEADVYAVLFAFEVTCPARAHAIKKLLCAGLRGMKSATQDLEETLQAVGRAIELEKDRQGEER